MSVASVYLWSCTEYTPCILVVSMGSTVQNMGMADPFGPRLTRARRKRRVSQEKLAELANMDRGHISKIESGKINQPTDEVVERLAAALQMSDAELAVEFRMIEDEPSRYQMTPTREDIARLFDQVRWTPNRLVALQVILADWID